MQKEKKKKQKVTLGGEVAEIYMQTWSSTLSESLLL